MSMISQAPRSLSVASPLGADVLLLTGFTGLESVSRLFTYHLDLLSSNEGVAARDIVGQAVTWSVADVDREPRYFNGVVCRFVAGSASRRGLRTYRAEVVPWTWFLTRSTDCRIFQNQSTPKIVETVFGDFGFSDFSFELTGSYPDREYCVQYRETAYNFITRLLEHEGIFFYFRHEEGKHTLVLADSPGTYADCPESRVRYSPGSLTPNHIATWERTFEFRSGRWTRTDYNFQTPSTNLLTTTGTTVDLPSVQKFELFDYPGEYVAKGVGDPVTKVRMEEEEAGFEVATGTSECCTFTPAGRFTLEGHEVDAENGAYVITSIQHSAAETSYGGSTSGASYGNAFTCIPNSVVYRPARVTPKPMVQGPQTAVVVGPAGEEIYVDKYGRVKVQFFWDRKGKKDENSSCWIRVSQQYSGKGWGAVCIPRIGQEVVVDFLEGDPDRPMITGRVYNGEQMPPYPLPGSMVMSGLKSKTHKGSGYNEMVFDDTAGKELIRVHGQYDMDSTINNDLREHVLNNRSRDVAVNETVSVGSDQSSTIGANRTEKVGANESITIGANKTVNVAGNHNETVDMNESITVALTRTRLVGINEAVTVGAAQEITVGAARTVTVGAVQTVTVGAAQIIIVGSDQTITVAGGETESYGGDHAQTVGGGQSVTVTGDGAYKIGGARATDVTNDDGLKVGKKLTIEAGDEIIIKTGDASIAMKKDGSILIKGKDILIQGSGKITEKADGDFVIKGSKVGIN
jgi:type VI secretion system secreted protein VgrG